MHPPLPPSRHPSPRPSPSPPLRPSPSQPPSRPPSPSPRRREGSVPDQLRIVIAEDNYLVREGLKTAPPREDSGEVDVLACRRHRLPSCSDAVRRLGPDAVLTDIRMPTDAPEWRALSPVLTRSASPTLETQVSSVLSQHTDESYVRPPLRKGGTAGLGYLLKDRSARSAACWKRCARSAGRLADRSAGGRDPRPGPAQPGAPSALPRSPASSTCCGRWRKARPTPASAAPCTCRSPRWKSTSTPSSPSSA